MTVSVSLTALAKQQVGQLRRSHRDAYDEFLTSLRNQGCAALGYRLTGDVVEHLCVKHLRGPLRIVVAFLSESEAVVVLVGPHQDDDPSLDVYTQLYDLVGVPKPKEKRTKPPCCGSEDGLPPLSGQDVVDELVERAKKLTRRR